MEVKIHSTRFNPEQGYQPKLALRLVHPYNPIDELNYKKPQSNQNCVGCAVIGIGKHLAHRDPARPGWQTDCHRLLSVSPDRQPLPRNWRQAAAVVRPLHRHVPRHDDRAALPSQWQKARRHSLEGQDRHAGDFLRPIRGGWHELDALLIFQYRSSLPALKPVAFGDRLGDGHYPGQPDLAALESNLVEKFGSKAGLGKLETVDHPVRHRNSRWGAGLARHPHPVLPGGHPFHGDDPGDSHNGLYAFMDDNTKQGVQSRKVQGGLAFLFDGRRLCTCPDRLDGPYSFSHYWILDRIPTLD